LRKLIPRAHCALDYSLRMCALLCALALLSGLVFYKDLVIYSLVIDPLLAGYGLVVGGYILARFVTSFFFRDAKDLGIVPPVAVVMPAFNEEAAIGRSIQSILDLDYPAGRLEVVVINDGSSDGTLGEIQRMAAQHPVVKVIDFVENRGKRAAMAAGIRVTSAEIVAFVDSDSTLAPDAMYRLVQGFANPKVGAVCGHTDVKNVNQSWLTRMQAVRYFVAFKVMKGSESVLGGVVTCCSGCFGAYRREAIVPGLDGWEHQRFLGRPATFGDDRALTNRTLRSWKVIYAGNARSETIVPHDFRVFMRQQLRWKRSWCRESLILCSFIWRRNPLASLTTYIGVLLPLFGPLVAFRALVYLPVVEGAGLPVTYLVGIYVIALFYGFYYVVRQPRDDVVWLAGVTFVFFYVGVLLWQTYWAIATAHSSDWGTRGVARRPGWTADMVGELLEGVEAAPRTSD
jgi:hyaluronan synthase